MAVKAMGQVSVIDVTDSYSVYLTCPTYTFPGTTGAAKPGSVTTDVVAMRGATQVAATIGTITKPSGVTVSQAAQDDGSVRLTVAVDGTVTAPGKVVVPVTVGSGDNQATFDVTFSYAIAFTGAKGDPGAPGVQGIQGPKGNDGVPGPKGDNGATTYFHIKYSSVASPTSSTQLSETPDTYIGTYVDFSSTDSTDPTKYTWSQFKGSQGDRGIPGTNGTNGKTSYLHIAYADSADGKTGFDVSSGANKLYIGQYTDFSSADSNDPTKYTWTKIKGEQGIKGDPGKTGPTGPTGAAGADALTLVVQASTTTFHNSQGSSTLSVHLFKGSTEVTSSIASYGTVKWYKDGTYLNKTGTSITVGASDVSSVATYTAKLEG